MHGHGGSGVRLRLETSSVPLLLRFVEGRERPQPVFEDEDPPPAECAERFLLQASQEFKRRRLDGQVGDAQAEDERVQVLHDCQRIALESLRRAETVSELLQRSTWGHDDTEQARFLHLHPAVQVPAGPEEAGELVEEQESAMGCWPPQLRVAGAAVATSWQHTELEGALRFLRQHWLIHCVRGQYLIELWNDSDVPGALDPAKGLAGRQLALFGQHPQFGVCVTFPHEIGRLVEWRHCLSVRISPLRAAAAVPGPASAREAPAPPPAVDDPGLPRGEAAHAVLLEAQRVLVDQRIFRRFREGLLRDGAPECRQHWHVLRASSTEILIVMPTGVAAELVHVSVSYGSFVPARSVDADPGSAVWDWLSDVARLRLRELFLLGPSAVLPTTGFSEPGNGTAATDLFSHFARWIVPQVEAVAYHLGSDPKLAAE
mmetsp:Transcript_86306/g.279461  ORF Transcript_86306/g.279461 Transcript_86306/m.279461 type:complete len:431 (-) Transcript_86306:52-1344(-)